MALLKQVAALTKTAGVPDFQQIPGAMTFLAQQIIIQADKIAFRDSFLVVTILFLTALLPIWRLHTMRNSSTGAR